MCSLSLLVLAVVGFSYSFVLLPGSLFRLAFGIVGLLLY